MPDRPNVVFILADQLRACSLPLYGEDQIETPNIDRLAAEGTTFTNMVSTCPVCTPYRSMLLTGRHPQTTGHVMNFVRTRHDEIGLGDVFARAGYRTAWIGKWHLHTGSFPQVEGPDFVPEGRDRLGFEFWRGYNFHTRYFDGWVNRGDWRNEQWEGYETRALNRYAFEFMDAAGEEPFLCCLSPHQPHGSSGRLAPEDCLERVPESLRLPDNVPERWLERGGGGSGNWGLSAPEMYRHYLAMTIALDDMVGELLDYLERTGRAQNTLFIFTSDHGSQVGAQDEYPWTKMRPYEESLLVPLVARRPGVFEAGATCEALTAPVDLMPTLCGLCELPVPRSVEGHDLSDAWRGRPGAFEQDAVLTMNFSATHDYLQDGKEWRGVRTKEHSYARWRDGREQLFDLRSDPLEMEDLAGDPEYGNLRESLEGRMHELMAALGDELVPCTSYAPWFDNYRRVVRNARGPLGNPEAEPDWHLLGPQR
ncbi:MAG: sulfatase [Candidatus Brocadiia bacterium]